MTSKKYHHLSQEQRYQIEALLKAGVSKKTIAETVDVDRSTIYREIKRNSTYAAKPPDRYKAANAQRFARARAYQPVAYKTTCPFLRRRLTFLLRAGWSPEQISETCRRRGLAMLSPEAIYLWLYEEKKKAMT